MSHPVTKEQCDFFRALYDEEERTAIQLEGRAKVYLGVISAFLAAILLKAPDAKGMAESLRVPWWLLLLEASAMTIALLLVLGALRIRNYEAATDGPELLESYEEVWPSESQFCQDRTVDYAVASAINRSLNNEAASLLAWASWTMAAGILFLLGIVVYAIVRR